MSLKQKQVSNPERKLEKKPELYPKGRNKKVTRCLADKLPIYTNEQLAMIFMDNVRTDYDKILRFCSIQFNHKKIEKEFIQDYLHECMIKTYERILNSGFEFINNNISYSGESFLRFIYTSMKNEHNGAEKKVSQKSKCEDEWKLTEQNFYDMNEELDKAEYHVEEDKAINEIFEYVELSYPPLEVGFFKFYFKTNYSYQSISEISGFGLKKIFKAVTKIKRDVINKFGNHNFIKLRFKVT